MRNTVVPTGNATTIMPKIITIIPKPILAIRDLLLTKIPVMTLSIPTISKRIPMINKIDTIAIPGKASIIIDKIIASAPSPT